MYISYYKEAVKGARAPALPSRGRNTHTSQDYLSFICLSNPKEGNVEQHHHTRINTSCSQIIPSLIASFAYSV